MNELDKTLSQQENAIPEPVVNTPEETTSEMQNVADKAVRAIQRADFFIDVSKPPD